MNSSFEIQLDKTTSFNLKGSAGIYVVGRSGSGKSNLASYIMLKAMSQCGVGLYIIDAKRADMSSLANCLKNGKKVVASTSGQIARLLRVLTENMNNRYAHFKKGSWGQDFSKYGYRPYFLLIDEVSAMLAEAGKDKNEILSHLSQLVLKGRQGGFITLISAQRLDATTLDRNISLQMGTRIVMGKADNETYRMAFPMVEDIASLPSIPNKPGYGLIFSDGQKVNTPIPFVAPDMSNIDVPKIISRMEEQYKPSKFINEDDYWQY